MSKLLIALLCILLSVSCRTKSVFGRYHSMSDSLGSLNYYVDVNKDGIFEQHYGIKKNIGHWKFIQDNGYELSNWINYIENDQIKLTIYVDIYENKLIEVPYFDEYNFEKNSFNW